MNVWIPSLLSVSAVSFAVILHEIPQEIGDMTEKGPYEDGFGQGFGCSWVK